MLGDCREVALFGSELALFTATEQRATDTKSSVSSTTDFYPSDTTSELSANPYSNCLGRSASLAADVTLLVALHH